MPRIVFFNHYLFFPVVSGGSLVVANHADYLIRRGMDVRIVVPLTEADEHLGYGFEHHYVGAGVRLIRLSEKSPSFRTKLYGHFRTWNLREHLAAFDMLGSCREVQEEIGQADIFVSNNAASAVLLDYANPQCVSIVETHNRWASLYSCFSRGSTDLREEADLETELLGRFDHIIAISPIERHLFLEHFSQDRVLYAPPHVARPLCEGEDSATPFDIGFLSSAWGPNVESIRDFYFEGYLPRLKRRQIGFVLAGKVSDAFGIHDHSVHKLGWVDRVQDFYSQCRIVICPIMYGAGCNIKLLEAMTLGKPIVATGRAISGMNVNRDRLLIEDNFQSFTDYILELVDSPQLLDRYSRRSIEQTDAGHTRDHYDEAMDRLYEAATKEVARRTKQGWHGRTQRNQPATDGEERNGLTAVVLLDPMVPQEDPTIYSELLRDPASAEEYRIHECLFRTDCSWTSSIDNSDSQGDGFGGLNLKMAGLPRSAKQTSSSALVYVNREVKKIAAVTVELIRGILRWIENASGHSGKMTFYIKRLKTACRERIEHRRSVRLKTTPFSFTAREIKTKNAIRRELLSTIDRLGLGPADLIVLPQINPLKLDALAEAIQERGVYRLPRLKLIFCTSIFRNKPSKREYLDRPNRDMELYREMFERLSDYESTGRLELIAFTESLKHQYEVITNYKFVVWPGEIVRPCSMLLSILVLSALVLGL
ncbi:MAG: glycosyltransferase family 4 protein [Desulfomonilaceae bacterium]